MNWSICNACLYGSIICLLIYWCLKRYRNNGALRDIPIPGPMGLPIIGNIHQMSRVQTHQLCKWSEEYGDLYKLRLGSQQVVVVSSAKLAKDLFNDPRLNGKPCLEAFNLFEGKQSLGLITSEGEMWAVHRKFFLKQLKEFGFGKRYSMEQLIMMELKELQETLRGRAGSPIKNLAEIFRIPVINGLWNMLTSERLQQDDPRLIKLATETIATFNEAASGSGALIFMPWLRHIIPELSGYRKLRGAIDQTKKLFQAPVSQHKATFDKNNIRDFIDAYLNEMRKVSQNPSSYFYGDLAERQLVAILFDAFFAGSDSTINTLSWAALFLCKHPEIQTKLQTELDLISGNESRDILLDDRQSMPYCQAVIDEVFRHSSVIADGVAHRATEDTEFQNYLIPKNAWVQPNLYFIHHNRKIWGDPLTFRPERFLTKMDNGLLKYEKNENLLPFQTGRRICVGEGLARDTIFLFIANLFLRFTMRFEPNSDIPSELDSIPGFFRAPKPFSVVLMNRLEG